MKREALDPVPDSFKWLEDAIRKGLWRAWEMREHYKLEPERRSSLDDDLHARDDALYRKSASMLYGVAFATLPGTEALLLGIANILDTYNPLAVSVLARSVIDWSARLAWLFDADVSSERRIARWWTEYLNNLWEERNVHRQADSREEKKLEGRIRQEVDEARQLGFTVALESSKRWTDRFYVAEPRKTSADLVERMYAPLGSGKGKLLWKFYSGLAHGTVYTILQMYRRAPRIAGSQREHAEPTGETSHIERPVAVALLAYMQAYARVVRCHGWERSYWLDWCRGMEPPLMKLLLGSA
jgi:hypothetical protein